MKQLTNRTFFFSDAKSTAEHQRLLGKTSSILIKMAVNCHGSASSFIYILHKKLLEFFKDKYSKVYLFKILVLSLKYVHF